MGVLEELRERDILDGLTSEEKFLKLKEGSGVYCGFDPSAESLHLGNYLLIATLKRLSKTGFRVVAVVGGATGRIGDPSFRNEAREVVELTTIKRNTREISKQLADFGFEVFDNYNIYKEIDVISFLREIGSLVNVNTMLTKDSVSARLENGLTFSEFSYQVMQGYDFCYLYEKNKIFVQVGGSDQWGNITTGLTMINKLFGTSSAVGITTKLMLDSDNQKFGKSKGGALWIKKELKNAFKCYQYLLNQNDESACKLLLWLTFLSLEETREIIRKHNLEARKRTAQETLARLVCIDIFGEEMTNEVILISRKLFQDEGSSLTKEQLEALKDSLPTARSNQRRLVDVLVDSGIINSRRQAKELILQGAIWIDFKRASNLEEEIDFKLFENNCLIRVGKKDYYLVRKG